MESDEQLRERLVELIPPGAWYTAEDLGTASGEELDNLAIMLGTERRAQ